MKCFLILVLAFLPRGQTLDNGCIDETKLYQDLHHFQDGVLDERKRAHLNGADVVKLHDVVIDKLGHIWPMNDTQASSYYITGAPLCYGCEKQPNEKYNCTQIQRFCRSYHQVHDHVISFSGYWQNGVWHFLFESLSPIQINGIGENTLLPLPHNSTVHVHEMTEWVLGWLDFMGINRANGYNIVHGTIAAKTAVFPRLGRCGGVATEHVKSLQHITNRVLGEVYGSPLPPCKNLMLLRRTKSRQFGKKDFQLLYNVIESVAAELHLDTIVFDDSYLSGGTKEAMAHQLHHWHTSCIAVAPHGAGLTQMFAMQKGSCVVEIHFAEKKASELHMYERLADVSGLKYNGSLKYNIGGGIRGENWETLVKETINSCYISSLHRPI
eukprot:m.267018 g.267018  ORF g.267018 m.267018 type:complete len:382 (+) comp16241_c0_seq2:209-1354(+)